MWPQSVWDGLEKECHVFPSVSQTRRERGLSWELRAWVWSTSLLLPSFPNPLWNRQAFPSPMKFTDGAFGFTWHQLLRPNANPCGMLRSKLTLTFRHLRTQNLVDSRRQLWRGQHSTRSCGLISHWWHLKEGRVQVRASLQILWPPSSKNLSTIYENYDLLYLVCMRWLIMQ